MEPETNTAPIWVLLGAKHGDNQQLLAIAEALNLPFRTIALQFNRLARQAPVLLGASRLSWHTDVPLEAPWPRALLAADLEAQPGDRAGCAMDTPAIRRANATDPREPSLGTARMVRSDRQHPTVRAA